MSKCNCKVIYHPQKEEYITSISMIKRGFDTLDMLWDTGAVNTVIYLDLLKNFKSIDKNELDKLEKFLECRDRNKIKYKSCLFGSVFKEKVVGILCCAHNVYVNHLHLENFYFFVLPASKNKIRGLLGADFISCCERQCSIGSDEIFTCFDEDLYERKFKTLTFTDSGEKPSYDLNLVRYCGIDGE